MSWPGEMWRDEMWEALPASDLKSEARHVLLTLACYADREDGCIDWPSTSTLARCVGLSRPTVFQHLKTLKADGWIVRTSAGADRIVPGRARQVTS